MKEIEYLSKNDKGYAVDNISKLNFYNKDTISFYNWKTKTIMNIYLFFLEKSKPWYYIDLNGKQFFLSKDSIVKCREKIKDIILKNGFNTKENFKYKEIIKNNDDNNNFNIEENVKIEEKNNIKNEKMIDIEKNDLKESEKKQDYEEYNEFWKKIMKIKEKYKNIKKNLNKYVTEPFKKYIINPYKKIKETYWNIKAFFRKVLDEGYKKDWINKNDWLFWSKDWNWLFWNWEEENIKNEKMLKPLTNIFWRMFWFLSWYVRQPLKSWRKLSWLNNKFKKN